MENLCLFVISTLKDQNHVHHNSFMKTMSRILSRKTLVLKMHWILAVFQNAIAVSNGLSDFHKMVITVMKMSFKKHSPIERHYRGYRYFDRTNLTLYRPNIHRKTPVLESYFSEYVSGSINYFLKEFHLRCLTGF